MENKKKIITTVLSVLVCVMAVGYAVLSTQLNINGTASIDSTWRVEITNITDRDIVGDATNKVAPSYTATTANFSVGLIQPGDSITYDIEVTNSGTLDAVLESINITLDENEAITYTTSGLKKGDKLAKNGGQSTLTIKVEYNPDITSQPTDTISDLTVTINYEQDLGQVVLYNSYSIGDQVTFAGSNWYVIKNSTSEEDYVTLMRETTLSNTELGEYAADRTIICRQSDVNYGRYGCTTEGEIIIQKSDKMSYYWSDTCHYNDYYGYTNYDVSGCSGHTDYEGSKVKEYLEGTYIDTLGTDSLKEVDGYKIRLITKDELHENFGYSRVSYSAGEYWSTELTPSWVYNTGSYWVMTPHEYYGSSVYYVSSCINDSDVGYHLYVRPVINLLKSSI